MDTLKRQLSDKDLEIIQLRVRLRYASDSMLRRGQLAGEHSSGLTVHLIVTSFLYCRRKFGS